MDRFDDPKSYRQKRESFTRSLQHFHETRGSPFRKIPQFCGKEVDLFRLYNVVTQRGGWVKVNRTNQWKDILQEFHIPKGCVNGGNAIKQIYMRYLDRYEKVHYLGESSDRHDLDEEDIETRHRRWSTRSIHTVPLTYNHHQHNIIDNLRKFNGLSSDIYKPSDYDRLALSLVSPLPNEQDFAINVCTHLSKEGEHSLKLEKCPRIIDYLLAHAGVYNHSNLRILFEEVYGQIRGHSLSTFWSDVLENNELIDLTDENNFIKKLPTRYKVYETTNGRTCDGADGSFSADNESNLSQIRNSKKTDSRTSKKVDSIRNDLKDNDNVDTRISNTSENPTDSIQNHFNDENQNACCNDSSKTSIINENDVRKVNDEPVLNTEKLNESDLNSDSNKVVHNDQEKSVKNVEPDTPTVLEEKITNNCDLYVEKVVKEVAVENEIGEKCNETNVLQFEVNICTNSESNILTCDDKHDESYALTNPECKSPKNTDTEKLPIEQLEENNSRCDDIVLEQESLVSETPIIKQHFQDDEIIYENENETELQKSEIVETIAEKCQNENEKEKTEEEEEQKESKNIEVVLAEEQHMKKEEKIVELKEQEEEIDPEVELAEQRRLEEEERAKAEELKARQEAEEKKRIEEERVKAIEEAKKLKRQMKEAEIYEAMLREEEKKKKVFFYDETPVKKAKNSEKSSLKIEPEDLELFCLGRQNGTYDYIGQRVLQVAHILRNLTFCEESMQVMAKNTTFLRFLLLCINSKWSCLHQLGLDMLGNISPELTIEDPAVDRIFQVFFWTVHRGIQHSNRFFVISCLEILNKICQKDENEDVVCRNLDQNIYDQVCRLLSLHDIMILLYTLECLYSISSMGEKACTYICRSKGAIEMLLALITVEAQSYGPKACILMRVIETRSGTSAAANITAPHPPTAASPNPQTPLMTGINQQCIPQSIVSLATPTKTLQTTIPKIITSNIVRAASPKSIIGVPMAAVATPVQATQTVCTSIVQTLPSVQQQHAHQQTVQENEQFALAWIRANFELSAGGKVEQQDLYKRYVESCNKIGRKGVIASSQFPRFVRSVFGGTVGPKAHPIPAAELKPGGPVNQSFYEGIKVRDVPLTINIKLVPVTEVPRPVMKKRPQVSTPKPKSKRKKPESPTSPILKAQLISPNKPSSSSPTSSSTLAADGKVQVSTQTHPVQIGLGQSSSPPQTPPPMDNSTLIKSLLASKVSEMCMTAPVGMLSDNSQVTQRQQQQKILQQQQLQVKLDTPAKTKVVRLNGIIQDQSTIENHLMTAVSKNKKEPPQPPPSSVSNVGNTLRPKTPKLDGEDSNSMTSTSRDCGATGGENISSADDNDNSLTSFEGIFNGIPESLNFDATVSSIVKENCAKKSESKSVPSDKNTANQKVLNEEGSPTHIPIKSLEEANDNELDGKSKAGDTCSKQTQSKSLMLADLLDKNEGPALNGVLGKDLRIGEKGLELVEKAILKETHLNHKGVNVKKDSVVSVNGEARTGIDRSTVINNATCTQSGSKRSAQSDSDHEPVEKKRLKVDAEAGEDKEKREGQQPDDLKSKKKEDAEEVNGEEEVRASSTAANLFAALAAETLEDETDFEVPSDPQPQTVVVPGQQIRSLYLKESSPLIVTTSGARQFIMTSGQLSQQGQVLISAGGQSLPVLVQNQRIVQGGSGQVLVAPQSQQIIMSGNTQSQMFIAQPQTALVQGQPQTVLVAPATSQQPGTKTIIGLILQPQSQGNANSQQQKVVVTSQGPSVVVARQVVQSQIAPPLAATSSPSVVAASTPREGVTTDVFLNTGMQNNTSVPSLHQNGSQIQIISSGVQNNAPILNQNGNDKTKTPNQIQKNNTNSKTTDGSVFLCEWRGCMRSFKTANEVYMHVCNSHCPSNAEVETQCLWERCDGMKRKRFSLMTHLFDRHCNADALNMMAARRRQLSTQGRSEIPAPTPPPPHPGYAPNAAFHAIKRHALEFVNPKELLDDNEGPVTKSIRLTASLILRNLVIYSSVGRRFLKGYEPHLASIALSNVESSRTIAQVLADLNDSSSR